ncbi:hypothetical protein QVD17_29783 [Tagetes erecta]|uniref:IBH1-like N-terminal domain-containing protein n=1 Tax=Tagetes erecta TaxID=13708 RepID=A0AAD8NFG3_TARER|nr:hypothetical protein QVD17_29783 [Tagetes erecta]
MDYGLMKAGSPLLPKTVFADEHKLYHVFKETKMHNSSQLKKEFAKKWAQGLQIYCSSKNQMNLLQRSKNIKLSADIALAYARNSTTCWSKAIISKAKLNRIHVNTLSDRESKLMSTHQKVMICHKRFQSKKILKKSCGVAKKMKKMEPRYGSNLATCIAKRLVKKRTQVLKRLVPGGEFMDEYCIIKEAIDYMLSLRVQVDVMNNLVNATTNLN